MPPILRLPRGTRARRRRPALGPGALYAALLSDPQPTAVRHTDGQVAALPLARYLGRSTAADARIAAAAGRGPVLDVGCGPGRMLDALTARGVPALGIDRSQTAVAHARRRGRDATCCDVFGPVPGAGTWGAALLVDGNVGIGGDPARLLARVADLLAADGRLVVEVGPPGGATGPQTVRLESGTRVSSWFAWAAVSVDDIAVLAVGAGLGLVDTFHEAGRWFACLA